jgi:predicted Fe-S protein YdhL (DUF1289 family)
MQLEFFDVPSPCIGLCQSDDKGQCIGCFRTRTERQTWINLNSDDKQKVIKRCKQRIKRKEKGATKKGLEQEQVLEIKVEILQPSLLEPPPKVKIDNSPDLDLDFTDFEL